MPGGKRNKSLEDRLRAVRDVGPTNNGPTNNGDAHSGAEPDGSSIASALAEYAVDTAPERGTGTIGERPVEPEFEAAFKARFEALLEASAQPQIGEPVEAILVEESSGPAPAAPLAALKLAEPRADIGDFDAPVAGHRPPAPARATDRELSEVHDQLEALRTSASEGDTFLPAGASAPPSAPPVPPASSSFLDRFSMRGPRGATPKETSDSAPSVFEASIPASPVGEALVVEAPVVEELVFETRAPTLPTTGRAGRVGHALIGRGLITSAQYDAALALQRSSGRRIGDALVDMGAISPFELVRVLADHMGVPFVDLQAKPPDPYLASLLPEADARRYDALPVARWNDELVIAMANPTDVFALDDLQLVTGESIIPALAFLVDLRAEIDRAYQAL